MKRPFLLLMHEGASIRTFTDSMTATPLHSETLGNGVGTGTGDQRWPEWFVMDMHVSLP